MLSRMLRRTYGLYLALAVLLATCTLQPGVFPPWSTPSPRGSLTVRLRQDVGLLNPLSEDPAARPVIPLLFAGLFRLDADLKVQPDLVERWDVAADGRVWIFQLRPNLRWHDGMPLTADDAAFSLRLYLDDRLTGGKETAIQQVVESVTVLNRESLRLALRRPFAPLLAELAAPILPRHLLEKTPDPARVALTVGSGPFRFVEHRPGQSITLRANPTYHGHSPRLAEVVFRVIPDERSARDALAEGSLLLGEVDPETAASLPPSLPHHTYAELGYNYVGFNLREGRLFADRNLRLAWAYGVDKQAVVAAATGGKGTPIWSHIPPASWAYDPQVPRRTRDVARARDLLAASGWRDADGDGIADKEGRPLSFDLLVRDDAPDRLAAARLMSEQLREVGMNVRVRAVDFGSDLAARRLPPFDFDALVMGWDLGPDPDDYYLLASGQIPSAERPNLLNYVGFRHPEFDQLSLQARTALDYDQRKQGYALTQRIVAQEQPYFPLWARQTHLVASPRLKGPLNLDSPLYLWNVEQWRVEG